MTVLLIFSAIIALVVVTDLRKRQLSERLQVVGENKYNTDTAGLLARYKRLYHFNWTMLEKHSDYILEARHLLAVWPYLEEEQASSLENLFKGIVDYLAQYFSKDDDTRHKVIETFEVAYTLERMRKFDLAASVYDYLLTFKGLPLKYKYFAFLHRGFSLSLIGELEDALKDLQIVENSAPNQDMSQVAKELIGFITARKKEFSRLNRIPVSKKKGLEYMRAMYFGRAVSVFSFLLKEDNDVELNFLRARSFEELGRYSKAVEDYKVVLAIKNGKIYQQARNRITVLNSIFQQSKLLKESRIIESRNSDLERILNPYKVAMGRVREGKNPISQHLKLIDKYIARREWTEEEITAASINKNSISNQKINIYKIITSDGSLFQGPIVEQSGSIVKIKTRIGVISIPKNEIVSKEKVN